MKHLTLKQIRKALEYGDQTECATELSLSIRTVQYVLAGEVMNRKVYEWLNKRANENIKFKKILK